MAYLVCHPRGGVTLAQTRPDKGKLYAGVFFRYYKVHFLTALAAFPVLARQILKKINKKTSYLTIRCFCYWYTIAGSNRGHPD